MYIHYSKSLTNSVFTLKFEKSIRIWCNLKLNSKFLIAITHFVHEIRVFSLRYQHIPLEIQVFHWVADPSSSKSKFLHWDTEILYSRYKILNWLCTGAPDTSFFFHWDTNTQHLSFEIQDFYSNTNVLFSRYEHQHLLLVIQVFSLRYGHFVLEITRFLNVKVHSDPRRVMDFIRCIRCCKFTQKFAVDTYCYFGKI